MHVSNRDDPPKEVLSVAAVTERSVIISHVLATMDRYKRDKSCSFARRNGRFYSEDVSWNERMLR